ncbi:MAG: IS30 family transposase [Acidimicrobiia bacterium]|nr:IS30 family transposase [Acidimicrobiia bacterium]MBV8296167.1 IS30 family transposase [Acidimicrobiia bacterium]
MYVRFTAAEQSEIWDRHEAGESQRVIARAIGHSQRGVGDYIAKTGGIRPLSPTVWSDARLSLADREEISRGIAGGESCRQIAARLERAASTISREVAANGGRHRYRACDGESSARLRARRPRQAKLTRCPKLRRVVEAKLEKRWSPQQIADWLPDAFPDDPEMRVSHETIYMSLFVQGRGALRKELHRCLRQGRAMRRPRARTNGGFGQGKIRDMVMISERPAEVEDRAVPGHWEGDLLMGKGMRAIGTLVERSSRYVMLFRLPEGNGGEAVRRALAKRIITLPTELRRSITWDQGKEMNEHGRFTVDTGVQIYFCDPASPWQRGSNENTNGLLRQYFPKGSEMSVHSQAHLNAVARELNERPRRTLGGLSPSTAFAEAVASIG